MSPILEVLIGKIFLYRLLSILVTQNNDFIANILKLRAKYLKNAIAEKIRDEQIRAKD
jgi:hypothetical protein